MSKNKKIVYHTITFLMETTYKPLNYNLVNYNFNFQTFKCKIYRLNYYRSKNITYNLKLIYKNYIILSCLLCLNRASLKLPRHPSANTHFFCNRSWCIIRFATPTPLDPKKKKANLLCSSSVIPLPSYYFYIFKRNK